MVSVRDGAAHTARHTLTPTSTTNIPSSIRTPAPHRTLTRSSHTVYSVIAALASSSGGSPLCDHSDNAPPSFLCPSLELPVMNHAPQIASSSKARPSRRKATNRAAEIPDKYEQGADGRWRLVSKASLYGSVICRSCSSLPEQKEALIASPTKSQIKSTASSITAPLQRADAVPSSWAANNSNKSNPDRTTLILAVSISLAFFIGFVMLGCLIWRKRKRKSTVNAIEMQPRARSTHRNSVVSGTAIVHERAWARATARWKATAKLSARRRRGPRIVHTKSSPPVQNADSSGSSSDLLDSPTSSSSAQNSGEFEDLNQPEVPEHSAVATSRTVSPRPPSVITLHHSPPAYVRTHSSTSLVTHRSRSVESSTRGGRDSLPPHDFSISTPLAHVATDDKAVLARMERMASAPTDHLDMPISSSAPILYEDSAEDFIIPADHYPAHHHQLPSPPAKMAYQSPFADEYATAPPAPPFEELASAPSAPPLEDMEDPFQSQEVLASAPPADDEVPMASSRRPERSRSSLPVYHA